MNYETKVLTASDGALLKQLLTVFSEAFHEPGAYQSAVPDDAYLQQWLAQPQHVVIVALDGEKVVGGLVAYEWEKFEQVRKEMYLYDLAVAETHRRQGIATALIERLKHVAEQRGVYVIFVQADTGPDDQPAIQLYQKLGTKEEVLHFEILLPNRQ